VAAIQSLLQQLRRPIPSASQQHGPAVQLMLGFLVNPWSLNLGQDLPQLTRRQAGADDGTVKTAAQLPDAPALWLWERLMKRKFVKATHRWSLADLGCRSRQVLLQTPKLGRHASLY
jgi:hypothetical protein